MLENRLATGPRWGSLQCSTDLLAAPPQESHTHCRTFGSRTKQEIQHEVPEKVILSTDSAGKEIVWRLGLCFGLRWGSLQCCPRLPCQLPPFQELHPRSLPFGPHNNRTTCLLNKSLR